MTDWQPAVNLFVENPASATMRQPLQMQKVATDIARPRSLAGKISEQTIHGNGPIAMANAAM